MDPQNPPCHRKFKVSGPRRSVIYLNRVVSVISVELSESTLTISDSTDETVSKIEWFPLAQRKYPR